MECDQIRPLCNILLAKNILAHRVLRPAIIKPPEFKSSVTGLFLCGRGHASDELKFAVVNMLLLTGLTKEFPADMGPYLACAGI